MAIPFILLQDRQGKTRLAKYYVPFEESEKHKVEYEGMQPSTIVVTKNHYKVIAIQKKKIE
ncbi:AP-2 complex subunit sigma [Acorus calamus]|uniref:AP-2 complex subunit sigma n=1 Tax=Acorus calamus TaxID=4465 RepID=A0AAV9D4M1_ACOCL|nr:AP-2 complex subunit sigma [Acorus calamus]